MSYNNVIPKKSYTAESFHIKEHTEEYERVEKNPDPNIDFRRVPYLIHNAGQIRREEDALNKQNKITGLMPLS